MEVKRLFKEWRIWVLLLTLLLSTIWIGPHYERQNGELTISTRLEDRMGIQMAGGTRLLLDVQSNLTGSELQNQAQEIREILDKRIAASGFDADIVVQNMGGGDYNIRVESSTTNQTRFRELIQQQGTFEARMPLYVQDRKNFTIYDTYQFNKQDSNITIVKYSGSNKTELATVQTGERFELGPTYGYYIKNVNGKSELSIATYTGEDISTVRTSDMRTTKRGDQYITRFPVVLKKGPAEVMHRVFSNYNPTRIGNRPLTLDNGTPAKLALYVDGSLRESLTVASSLGLETSFSETTSTIRTTGGTAAEARQKSTSLQAILKSGSLPAPLKIVRQSTVTATLGQQFITASLLSIIGALIAVGILVFIRYRDPKYAIPIVLTGASEVYILLGFWSWFTPLGSLGLSAIAGIIAAVGTGVDDQIIITDESEREKVRDWSSRMKRAFFVIFTSAASTIGAMTPILAPGLAAFTVGAAGLGLIGYVIYTRGTNYHYLAVGTAALMISIFTSSMKPAGGPLSDIHGFAATTILGIMIGITVTRPAYAKFLEYL